MRVLAPFTDKETEAQDLPKVTAVCGVRLLTSALPLGPGRRHLTLGIDRGLGAARGPQCSLGLAREAEND